MLAPDRAASAATWDALAQRVVKELGLNFPQSRRADLERGIAAAAQELGHADALQCASSLLAAPWSRRQLDVLAHHLTIGETYFFRDRGAFAVLEDRILPSLLRARSHVRRLRIWSAGCSTGEEPYSIAMLLQRAIPDIDGWNISILATDVDPQALARAERGVYGEWSFRDMPHAAREGFFNRAAQGRYEIAPQLRKRVEFRLLNLARDAFPSIESGTNAMDVVFCRNVLMYFEPQCASEVLRKLGHALAPGGWLFLNPVEVPHLRLPELKAVHFEGAIVHRKVGSLSVASPVVEPAAPPVVPTAMPTPPDDRTPSRTELKVDAPEPGPPKPDARELVRRARECADRGELEHAREWCERAVAADKLDADAQYLLASVLQELKLVDAAAGALRRAVYIEPRHVLAHYALGNLARRAGREPESLRHFRNALRAVSASAPGEAPRGCEGIDAARMAEVIRSTMERGPR
jgi:chemotaxis protein methyltransferase CheR